jgi:hypothetical protein
MDMRIGSYFKTRIICVFFTTMICVCGCTVSKAVVDSLDGNYMGGLERIKDSGKSQVLDYGIEECFKKVADILQDTETIKAKILKTDRRRFAILALVSRGLLDKTVDSVFDPNDADVGIFLTEESASKTKVTISCLSSLFRDYAAEKIFTKLKK